VALTWTEQKWGGWSGLGGGRIRLFDVSWRTSSRTGKDWKMTTTLPGFTRKTWEDDDPEQLKTAAEKFLAAWCAHVQLHRLT
jgi:hypothetical protein